MTTGDIINLTVGIVQLVALMFTGYTAYLVRLQVSIMQVQAAEAQEWNRKKATQEVLCELYTNSIQSLLHRLRTDFIVDVLGDKCMTYEKELHIVDPGKLDEFQSTVGQVCNTLEIIEINIQRDVLHEEIAKKFLGPVFNRFFQFLSTHIMERKAIFSS